MEEKRKTKLKKFSKELALPLILLLIYIFLFGFQNIFHVPPENSFINWILNFIGTQSIWLIFAIAFIEGTIFFGQYTPGWVVIFLSLISYERDLSQVFFFVSLISVAFILAYTVDYFVGYFALNRIVEKFGFHKMVEKYQKMVGGNLLKSIFFSYWETSIASIVASMAGFLRMPFRKFFAYTVACVLFWNVFWATLFLTFGSTLIDFIKDKFILVVILGWMFFVVYKHFIKSENKESTNL